MSYRSIAADVMKFKAGGGAEGELYYARPTAPGSYPGVVLIMHMPGWDNFIMEATRNLAHNGFAAVAPHLYFRFGPGAPDDVAAKARAAGGEHDDNVVADVAGAMAFLRSKPESNGKVGVMGFCSGGRHTFIAACKLKDVNAVVDCWGGNLLPGDPSRITPKKPVTGIEYIDGLSSPLLGIFGNDDKNPSPADVNTLEAELKARGKPYTFHRYDGAGHSFFDSHRAAYRPEQAQDAWKKIFAFYNEHLR